MTIRPFRSVLLVSLPLAAFLVFAQKPRSTFEVVSVRPVKDCEFGPPAGAPPDSVGKKSGLPGGAGAPAFDPTRLNVCGTVYSFVHLAYVISAAQGVAANKGMRLVREVPIEGGPAWFTTENYSISAKAEGSPGRDAMTGPMLQALLADRFHLKLHRESRAQAAYALTLVKGGPKMPRSTCFFGGFDGVVPPGRTPCPMEGAAHKGPILAVDRFAKTTGEFAQTLLLDRPVIDRTGLSGIYDFHFEFAPDDTTPLFLRRIQEIPDSSGNGAPPAPAGGPSIFTAFQEQLGLKLEPVKAPQDVFVIDSVERPPAN